MLARRGCLRAGNEGQPINQPTDLREEAAAGLGAAAALAEGGQQAPLQRALADEGVQQQEAGGCGRQRGAERRGGA